MIQPVPNQDESQLAAKHQRLVVAMEFTLSIGLLVATIWVIHPVLRTITGILGALSIFSCFARHGRLPQFPQPTGFKLDTVILVGSIATAIMIAATFYSLDLWTPNFKWVSDRTGYDWMLIKVPTVIIQQLLFQLVFVPTLKRIIRKNWLVVLSAATAFGALHLPNPLLVLLTFLIGLIWFALVVERTRLAPLILSHLILAVAVANVAEDYVLDMRVGPVCFQKWPQTLSTGNSSRSLQVYPRLLSGELKQITQFADLIKVTGSVQDVSRQKIPARVHVVFGTFDPQDDQGTAWRPLKIESIRPDPDSGEFQLQVPASSLPHKSEVRLFAQHRNGWTYPIHGSARIESQPHERSEESICLYPREIFGNIGHIRHRRGQTVLNGWGFDFKQRKPLDAFLVLDQQQADILQLERRSRSNLAELLNDERLEKCGFTIRVKGQLDHQSLAVYARNSTGRLERLGVELVAGHQEPTITVAAQPGILR